MKAFRKELDSKLTKEQLARLRKWMRKAAGNDSPEPKRQGNDSINRRSDGPHDDRRFREGPPSRERRDSADSR